MKKYRQDLALNLILLFFFCLLQPVTEWPDATYHFEKSATDAAIYPTSFLANYLEEFTRLDVNYDFSFFSDQLTMHVKPWTILLNLERLPIAIAILSILHIISKKSFIPMAFNPPLVYSIIAPSQEIFSIFLILCALYSIDYKNGRIISVLLCAASLAIDRSMIASASIILLIGNFSYFRKIIKETHTLIPLVALACFAITKAFSPTELFAESYFNLLPFGISYDDILYNSSYGAKNYLALLASSLGLYGSMSIRPYPFFIYYPAILLILAVGFRKANSELKNILFATLIIIILILWLIPPLSQARYYPILTICLWHIINNAFSNQRINFSIKIFVIFLTVAGLANSVVHLN